MGRMSKKLRYLRRKFRKGQLRVGKRRVTKGRDITRMAISSRR